MPLQSCRTPNRQRTSQTAIWRVCRIECAVSASCCRHTHSCPRHSGKHAAHGCRKCRSCALFHRRLMCYSRSLLETSMVSPSNVANKAQLTSLAPQQDDRLVSSTHLVSLSVLISCRVAVVFALQSWLAESPEQRKTSATPAYFQVGMSRKSQAPGERAPLMVCSHVAHRCKSFQSGACAVQRLIACHRVTLRCSSRPRQATQAWVLEPKLQLQLLRHRCAGRTPEGYGGVTNASGRVSRSKNVYFVSCNRIIE
jgi:hypothetical protein